MACTAGTGGIDLGIPTWYEGLCQANGEIGLSKLSDIWVVAGNILDMLLFIVGIVAVIYIIYSGISYTTSQGQPDKMTKAKQGLIYAAVGLIVSVLARVLIQYIAGQFNAPIEVQ